MRKTSAESRPVPVRPADSHRHDGGDRPGDLAVQVGRLLQAVRLRARISQAQVAERAGTSQQWVSRVERGVVNLRLADAERLFAGAAARLVVHAGQPAEEQGADPDLVAPEATAEVLAETLGQVRIVRKRFAPVPHVVAGRLAALAQGLPVRPGRLDLLVAEADLEGARAALTMLSTRRWSDRHQAFFGFDIDVDRPGERRWLIGGLVELWIDVVPVLPEPITVLTPEGALAVLPLMTLLRDDGDIAELARRTPA